MTCSSHLHFKVATVALLALLMSLLPSNVNAQNGGTVIGPGAVSCKIIVDRISEVGLILESYTHGFTAGANWIFAKTCPAMLPKTYDPLILRRAYEEALLFQFCEISPDWFFYRAIEGFHDLVREREGLDRVAFQQCEEDPAAAADPPPSLWYGDDALATMKCEKLIQESPHPNIIETWIQGYMSGFNSTLGQRCAVEQAKLEIGEPAKIARFSSYTAYCQRNPEAFFWQAVEHLYSETRQSQGLAPVGEISCAVR